MILHNIIERSGIAEMQTLNLSEKRLMDLISKTPFQIKIITKK